MDFNRQKRLIEEFFNGKFEVKKFLGEGSFAKVFLVNHNYLDTLMAMKIVKDPLSVSTNKKDVFREVTLACQLRHRNIISIYDAAEITNFEDGKNHAYFVMEYVPGGDLQQFLNSFAENDLFLPIDRCLDLIRQILSGLNTLHSSNPPIIHRDLKLNNVLLSFDAHGDIIIKISDFGFAKEVTTTISDIDVAGTRPYMAPELFNKLASTKSDIYAVGVMFYQLLTNRFPYDVDGFSNDDLINLKPWQEDLKAPSYYNENVSDALDELVLKSLEFDPDERYCDAAEFLEDVENYIDEYKSSHVVSQTRIDDYRDDCREYVINDSIEEAFRLAKCENGLSDAIEILEGEVVQNHQVRKFYSETLRIWKSKRPDLKLISKAFTVNLKAKNYKWSCNLLMEAIAYNPSLKYKYQHYLDLWEIFIDLKKHGSLVKAVFMLENLMDSNEEIRKIYRNILPTLKTYSIEEIVAKSLKFIDEDNFSDGANLMEFAVVSDLQVRKKYEYGLALWKQNMKMQFRHTDEIKTNSVDYAIDLGTVDSVVSYFNNGNPIIIKNHKTGEEFTPSAVLIDDEDNVEVGEGAKRAILENDLNAVSAFKQNMGFSVPFEFENSSKSMFPEELSAEVLKDLRVSAYEEMGVNIEHAVICVPANSNPMKTRAVMDAAELAGFRSYNLILEPIAVSLAYGLRKDNGIWMIYDLGGGTFNVTLIRDNGGEIEKLATDGVENVGGIAFDWKIVNDLFKPKVAGDLNLNDFRRDNAKYFKAFAMLKNAAEIAKKDLAVHEKTQISIDGLFEGYDFEYELDREQLRECILPIIEFTFDLSRNLLDENSLSDRDIDRIILVGGSSLSPVVQDLIAEEFDIEMESGINPMTVVARGAAIYAGSLEKPSCEVKDDLPSLVLDYANGEIRGRVFSDDLKFSFLGFFIEFKNDSSSVKVPLDIDGSFKFRYGGGNLDVNLYDGNDSVSIDEKSPDNINEHDIHIPFLNRSFSLNNDLNVDDLAERYYGLAEEIDYLKEYLKFDQNEIQNHIEILLEIAQNDEIANNQANIYIEHLRDVVFDVKKDLEFSVLLENVLNKIEIVKANDLFEVADIDEISKSRDLEKLRQYHADLIERYVMLNRNSVIEQCFFSLKLDGVYSKNEKLAGELIERGLSAIGVDDYSELYNIINSLYELDERTIK